MVICTDAYCVHFCEANVTFYGIVLIRATGEAPSMSFCEESEMKTTFGGVESFLSRVDEEETRNTVHAVFGMFPNACAAFFACLQRKGMKEFIRKNASKRLCLNTPATQALLRSRIEETGGLIARRLVDQEVSEMYKFPRSPNTKRGFYVVDFGNPENQIVLRGNILCFDGFHSMCYFNKELVNSYVRVLDVLGKKTSHVLFYREEEKEKRESLMSLERNKNSYHALISMKKRLNINGALTNASCVLGLAKKNVQMHIRDVAKLYAST